ncbi:MAG: Abi family protein [Clostridia bacterium]|nr:Abi family protein [Clostridia bacterium]
MMINYKLKFVSLEERLKNLKDLGLKIDSIKNAKTYINEIGYHKLFNCYKRPFWNNEQNKFKEGVTIGDLYQLYVLDSSLKSLLLNSALTLEVAVKVQMAEVFSEYMGLDVNDYLDDKYFRDIKKNDKIIKYSDFKESIYKVLERNQTQRFIKYYKTKYNQIPFWALSYILSFGEINALLKHLKVGYTIHVSKFWNQNHKFLISALGIVRMFRNACAHNEPVYSFKTIGYRLNSESIKDYLEYFNIDELDNNNHFTKGTNDLLAIFFIFKIMLPKNKFKEFVDQYFSIVKNFEKKVKSEFSSDIIARLNVPNNIRDLVGMDVIKNY